MNVNSKMGEYPRVIEGAEDISLSWLNDLLLRDCASVGARVVNFATDQSNSTHAHILKLRLTYEGVDEAVVHSSFPRSLILKVCRSEDKFVAASEVHFYARDYIGLPEAPIPKCYDAQYCERNGLYHVLMEDLSESHAKDAVPTSEYAGAVARALAKLHAHGWSGAPVRMMGEGMPDVQKLALYWDHVRQGFEPMLSEASDDVSSEQLQNVRRVLCSLEGWLKKRLQDSRGFCVVHGDLNPGNILQARKENGCIYFLDRQPFKWSLTTWLAASDLATFMVPYWAPSDRRELEQEVLRVYHRELQQNGIKNYEWTQLLADYRLAGLQSFCLAASWCLDPESRLRMRGLWMAELMNAIEFLHDHGAYICK